MMNITDILEAEYMTLRYLKPEQIKPSGWIATQLGVLSNGIFPALITECDQIGKSKWLGKNKDENGELFPVWLEGLIRLAYITDNKKMQELSKACVERVLELQEKDGWLSTETVREKADLYQTFLMMKALITYVKHTNNKVVCNAVLKAATAIDIHTDAYALNKNAHARFSVVKECIEYLYEVYSEEFLLALLKKLECQAFAWEKYEIAITRPSVWSDAYNNVIALRTQNISALREMEEKFVLASGTVAGSPTIERPSSSCNADTATMCEYFSTLIDLFEKTGVASLCDDVENLIFNAYFAALNPTMTAVQSQVKLNQIKTYYNAQEGAELVSFGGVLPKFISSAVMSTKEGFAINSYIPFVANVEYDGQPVKIETFSEYPFRDTVKIVVTCPSPTAFTLSLRIPSWADEVKISTGSTPIYPLKNSFYNFTGVWSETTEFTLSFSSDFKLTRREDDLFTLSKGILLFAMPTEVEKSFAVGEDKKKFPSYDVTASSKWSYGLVITNKDAIYKEISFEEKPVAQLPFSVLTPPIEAYIYGKQVEWQMKDGEPVKKPLAVKASDKKEMLRFVPYGCTSLKMTALPKA